MTLGIDLFAKVPLFSGLALADRAALNRAATLRKYRRGERIVIKSMADGTAFDENRTYRVAVNSYRAAGGGGLLTKGAGIDKAQLENRIVWRGDYTLRDYIIRYVREHSPITPQTHGNWQFVPAEWAAPAAKRAGTRKPRR